MGVFFNGATTCFLDRSFVAFPYSFSCWINPGQTGVQGSFISRYAAASPTISIKVGVDALSGVWAISANDGAGEVTGTTAGTAVANRWSFIVGRFGSNGDARISVLHPDKAIAHGSNNLTLSTASDTMRMGVGFPGAGEAFLGHICEWTMYEGDIWITGEDLSTTLLNNLAYRGPFSDMRLAPKIIEYRSFRKSITNLAGDNRNLYFGGKAATDVVNNGNNAVMGLNTPYLLASYRPPVGIAKPTIMQATAARVFIDEGIPPQNLAQDPFTNTSVIDTHSLSQTIPTQTLVQGIFDDSADTFFTPSLGGFITLAQSALFVDPDTIQTPVVTQSGAAQILSVGFFDDSATDQFFNALLTQTGGIIIVDKASAHNTGAALTLAFNITPQPDDVVYLFAATSESGGFPALAPSTVGYTQLAKQTAIAGNIITMGCWRKRMGASPDTSVTMGSTGLTTNMAAAVYILRNVHVNNEDVTTVIVSANTASPDPPAITPISNGTMILALAAASINDPTVTPPSGYGDQITDATTASGDSLTLLGSTKTLAIAAAENPTAYSNIGSSTWKAITVAVRPGVSLNKTVAPDFFDDSLTDQIFTPTAIHGPLTLFQGTFTNLSVIYAPVAKGLNVLAQGAFINTSDIFTHVLTLPPRQLFQTILHVNNQIIPQPLVTLGAGGILQLAPNFFANAQEFYQPTVTPQPRTLVQVALFTNNNTFFTHLLTKGEAILQAPFLVNTSSFFQHQIDATSTAITLSQGPTLINFSTFFPHTLVYEQTLNQPIIFTNFSFIFPGVHLSGGAQPEPPPDGYTFPIGRSYESDYGIRGSRARQRLVMGRH